jgi:hypothetical protein
MFFLFGGKKARFIVDAVVGFYLPFCYGGCAGGWRGERVMGGDDVARQLASAKGHFAATAYQGFG